MDPRKAMKKLTAIYDQVDAVYMRIAAAHGLSFNALMMLYLLDDDPRLTQKKACDALYLPKSSVHSILTGLMQQGLVELTPGGNKKEKYIAVTPEGQKLLEKILAETDKIESAALEAVPDQELTRLLDTAQALAGRLQQQAAEVYAGGGQNGH